MRRLFSILALTTLLGITCPASAAVTYTPFRGPEGAALSLGNVGIIGDGIGYGSIDAAGASAVLYKTVDNGAAWNQVGSLATTNISEDGHLEFYFGADEIWYTTLIKSSMYAYTKGKLGVSRDEGATWVDFNDQIDSLMASSSTPRDCFARAPGLGGCFASVGSMGNIWGYSGDGGAGWTWTRNEYFFGRFQAGNDQVLHGRKDRDDLAFLSPQPLRP